jgi:hypothetical protein
VIMAISETEIELDDDCCGLSVLDCEAEIVALDDLL